MMGMKKIEDGYWVHLFVGTKDTYRVEINREKKPGGSTTIASHEFSNAYTARRFYDFIVKSFFYPG